jgi:PRC-barrel domain
MNRLKVSTMLCASALALASSAVIAQQQPQFTPAAPAATGRLTADASSSTLLKVDGSRVIDITGQPLGRIDNVVLSPVGCVEAAILTAANGRLVPIPWTMVRVSGDTRAAGAVPGGNLVFTVTADQARLAQAPSFVRTQWPDMSSQAWLQPSIAFFGSPTAVGATGGATNVITGADSRTGTTATTVPTNSTALPPTGRPSPTPGFPPPQQGFPPPQNRNVPQQPQAPPPPQQAPPPQAQP